jgi:putative alpha-1,2-mannosidase
LAAPRLPVKLWDQDTPRVTAWWIPQREVVRGGKLDLELGPQPNKAWAATTQPPPHPVTPLAK